MRLPFSIKKRVLGGIVSSLSDLVYNSSVLPLAFFEKKYLKNKKINKKWCLSLFKSLMKLVIVQEFFFFFFLSQPHTSFLLSCLLLSYSHFSSLLVRLLLLLSLTSQTQNSVTHQSSATFISLPNLNPVEQTLVFPSQSQNLRLSPNHFSLLFCSQPHNVSSKP